VLGDLDIGAGLNPRKLAAYRLSKLGYVFAIKLLAPFSFSLAPLCSDLGISL